MGYTRRSPIRNSIRKESYMRKLLLLLSSLLLIWACSSKDDDSVTNSKDNTQQAVFDLDSNTEILDTSFIEILSIGSCLGMLGSKDLPSDVDTVYAHRYDENSYSIQVLANLLCYPSDPPDLVSYSYEGDTLIVSYQRSKPGIRTVCSCTYWVEILVKGEIDFNYIQSSAKVYAVKKESDEEKN